MNATKNGVNLRNKFERSEIWKDLKNFKSFSQPRYLMGHGALHWVTGVAPLLWAFPNATTTTQHYRYPAHASCGLSSEIK